MESPLPPNTSEIYGKTSIDAEYTVPLVEHLPSTPPRWWTTLLVFATSLGMFLVASVVSSAIAFVAVHGTINGELLTNPDSLAAVMKSRIGVVLVVLVPQLTMIIAPIAAAFLSPVEARKRLSLVRGHWPVWVWVGAAAATPLVGLISSLVVGGFMEESESLKQMSEAFRHHGATGFLIPIAFLIGATPALCEELLFRGYIQTRLTQSFHPFLGIFIASFFFAAMHMDIVHIVAVFPLGFYLGWLTWRSGSIFPSILAHFVNNVTSVVAVVFAPEEATDVLGLPTLMVSLSILVFGFLGLMTAVGASAYYGRPATYESCGK